MRNKRAMSDEGRDGYNDLSFLTLKLSQKSICISAFVVIFRLVVSEFSFEFPHVFVGSFHVVSAEFVQDFLQVRDGLLRDSNKVLERIVLMFFKGGEEHLLHFVLVGSLFLGAVLMLTLKLDEVGVVGNRLVGIHDSEGAGKKKNDCWSRNSC